MITDLALCDRIYKKHTANPIVFWKIESNDKEADESITISEVHSIDASDAKEITEKILSLLPDAQTLTENDFHVRIN